MLIKVEAPNQLLGQRAARTFSKDRNLRFEVISRLEIRFLLVVLVHAFIVGAYAGYAVVIKQQL